MNFFTFNQLSTKQLYDCLKLRTDIFVVEQDCAYPEIDEYDLIAHHLLYYQNNELIGYLRFYPTSRNTTSIGRVAVPLHHRKKGIAKHLIQHALIYIKNSELPQYLVLSAQTYLVNFYKSFGFTITSKEYLDYGIPHIDMELI